MTTPSKLTKLTALASVAMPLLAGNVRAQETAAPEIDIEARKQSITNLEQHIKDRELRKAEIVEDIVRLDTRIEERVDKIVGKLKTLKDSKDSRLKVAQTKEEVIKGLRDAIDIYDMKRRSVDAELAKPKPGVDRETLAGDAKVFDEKIEKRIDQIMELTNSLSTHKDYAKYVRVDRSRRWGRSSIRKNPDYAQNRQQSTRSNQDRKAVGEALEDSLDELQRKGRDLEMKLKNEKLSTEGRDLLKEERDLNEALIARREEQLGQLVAPKDPGTRAIGGSEAHSFDLLIRDMAEDLDTDFDTMFRHYADLNQERVQIKALSDNLAARKAWMKKYEAGEAK